MGRPALRVVLGIATALLILAGVGGAVAWWKIASLKANLVRDLGQAIGAQVQIDSLSFDLREGELRAAGISLTNLNPSAAWETAQVAQAVVHFHLSDVLSPKIPLRVEVTSWNVVMRPVTPNADVTSGGMPPGHDVPGTTSDQSRIEVSEVTAQEGAVEIDLVSGKKISIQGVSFDATNNGAGVWTTGVQANSVTADTLHAGASSVHLRSEEGTLAFSDLRLACGSGLLTGNGDAALSGEHAIHADLKAVEIPVEMLVSINWQMKLAGSVSGDVQFEGDDAGRSAQGHLAMSHAKFNVLPWLGQVTTLVGLQNLSNVEVDRATADVAWKDGTVHLTQIDIRKNDEMRLAGVADIDASGEVDARIKLGLPSSVTAKWPQLQTQVFPEQTDGFNWADVHLAGTPDHLQEDLTPRLLAAGLGQGGQLIDQAARKASDLLQSLLGK